MQTKLSEIIILTSKKDFSNVESHKFICFDFDYYVYHYTSKKIENEILANGFKTGFELQKAERRKAIFFSDKDVNAGLYSRNQEGELYEGDSSGTIKISLRKLKLLNLNFKNSNGEFENHSKYKNFVVKGELAKIPHAIDGTISFTKEKLIYEVALDKVTANKLLQVIQNPKH